MHEMKSREIPLNDSYEVIVIGGGPAGCTAAAACAREGANTLLLEGTSALGGMGTSALVPAWCPFSDKEKIIYKGLAEQVFQEAKKGMSHVKKDAMDWVPIDAERLKRVYDDLVKSHGADVLFNSFVSAVEKSPDDMVETLIVSNKSGLTAYRAKVFIDTTGDADIVAFAGGLFVKGEGETEGELQPATHCFILSNVDTHEYLNLPRLHGSNPESVVHRILAEKKYPLIPDGHVIGVVVGPGTVGFNAGHIWRIDNTRPESVSEGLMVGRKMAAAFRDALSEYAPQAFANAHLVSTGSLLGIRETRRIVGDYTLTVDDYANRRKFEDEIARNSYFIDVHSNVSAAEAKGKLAHYCKGESHGIPYRTLTPRGLKNVLVAGRSISCERMVQGSVRVMPVCLAMGEAAGIAAAHATEKAGDVRAIDIGRLRERIRKEGGYIL